VINSGYNSELDAMIVETPSNKKPTTLKRNPITALGIVVLDRRYEFEKLKPVFQNSTRAVGTVITANTIVRTPSVKIHEATKVNTLEIRPLPSKIEEFFFIFCLKINCDFTLSAFRRNVKLRVSSSLTLLRNACHYLCFI
jgi:hypothetical protein